jgi:hypothetical protein
MHFYGITTMSSLNFETKLSVVTGLNFTVRDSSSITSTQKKISYLDHITFEQIGSAVKCAVAPAEDHVQFVVNTRNVNFSEFDKYYDWKKRDIIEGLENAQILSQKTKLDLKSNIGIITFFDSDTDTFFKEAKKTQKIDTLLAAAADHTYAWRFVENEDKKHGIALYKKTDNWTF